jgi:uncharacterized protein YndB with AHSA1/START domain
MKPTGMRASPRAALATIVLLLPCVHSSAATPAAAASPATGAPVAAAASAPASAPAATPAPPSKLPAGVVDESFVRPDGERVLQLSAVVDGPPSAAWRAFTTSEGFTAWAVALARIDFRVGGVIESSYDASIPLGSDRTIRNEILGFVNERVLLIRNVQAPPNAPFDAPAFQETQTAVLFEPVDATHTRVTVVNGGYREGARFDGVYRHFRAGNAYTLAVLAKHLAKRAANPLAPG